MAIYINLFKYQDVFQKNGGFTSELTFSYVRESIQSVKKFIEEYINIKNLYNLTISYIEGKIVYFGYSETEDEIKEQVSNVNNMLKNVCSSFRAVPFKQIEIEELDEEELEIVEEVEVFCELLDLEDDETEVEGVVVQLAKTVNVAISENKYFVIILNTFYFASK